MADHRAEFFMFIVDTDTYAGNFERELTAFCTGQIGDCGVGQEQAERFATEHPDRIAEFLELMEHRPDDEDACMRPTSIWPTPGFWNDGMGNEWPDDKWDTEEVIQVYRNGLRSARDEDQAGYSDEEIEMMLPERYPAYRSVAMFTKSSPTIGFLEFLMIRAQAFAKESGKFHVTGFRVVRELIVQEDIWSFDGPLT